MLNFIKDQRKKTLPVQNDGDGGPGMLSKGDFTTRCRKYFQRNQVEAQIRTLSSNGINENRVGIADDLAQRSEEVQFVYRSLSPSVGGEGLLSESRRQQAPFI